MSDRTWTLLHSHVQRTLKRRALLPRGQQILLGVSGGQDSRCLLQLLIDLQPQWQWQLAVVHCDHRWPPDSGANADYVAHLAAQLQLPYFRRTAPRVLKGEAEGREWRYWTMAEIAQQEGFGAIVTAHTATDRAETLLFNLIRGSGLDGLQALTWSRPLAAGMPLVRPLLDVTRAETGSFCEALGLSIWSDVMNQDLHYRRNRIRQVVLPYLSEHFNPQVEGAIARTAELLHADVCYLEQQADTLLQAATVQCPADPLPSGATVIAQLRQAPLKQAPFALQRRAIRQFLHAHLHKAPTFDQVEKVTALVVGANRDRTDPLVQDIVAEVHSPWLCLAHLAGARSG